MTRTTGLIRTLKKLASMYEDENVPGYSIYRYWNPESGKSPEFVKSGLTLKEAQEHCQREDTHNRSGPESTWYFEGYVASGSRTATITLWDAARDAHRKTS